MKIHFNFSALFFIVLSIISRQASAQKTLTLTDCIKQAVTSNLQIQQQLYATQTAQANKLQANASALPSVNAYGTHNYNFGQTIDRFTNQFIQGKAVQSNNFYVQGAWTLFAGGQNYNNIQQANVNLLASRYDYDNLRNTITQNVAQNYLQVLLNTEVLKVTKNQLAQTIINIDMVTKRVNAGTAPQLDLLTMQAQKANEELNMVTAENNYALTLLSLMQLMNIADTQQISLAPIANIDSYLLNITPINTTDIYIEAKKSRPEIVSVETKLRSALFARRNVQGAALPTLTFNASVGTGYSGQSKQIVGSPTVSGANLSGYAEFVNPLNNEVIQAPTYTPTFNYDTRTTPFNTQIKKNINQSIGFSLQVPIFNNLRTHTAVQRAHINEQIAQINVNTAHQQLYKTIQQAVMEMNAANNKLNATAQVLNTQKETYTQATKRHTVGLLNSMDYLKFKTSLAKAEADYAQSKYEYVFKKTLVQFYATNKIEL
ncbi:MAG: TolC family protein [Bacteroidia bacterium]|nr:TolC family protein [Bacteroidia bacterium]